MLNVQTKETRKFELTEELKNGLASEMYTVLTGYDWNATKEACAAIVDKWAEDKAPLIEVLQNHPNWVSDKFQVVFNKSFSRITDEDAINNYLFWLESFFKENLITEREIDGHGRQYWLAQYHTTKGNDAYDNWRTLSRKPYDDESKKKLDTFLSMRNWFYDNKMSKVDKEGADFMNALYPDEIKAKEGMKASRLMHKICTKIYHMDEIWGKRTRYRDENGIVKSYEEDYRPFNSEFCKFADAINPIEYQMHTIISVNPVDYLTMSIGNSWASCHSIDFDHDGDTYDGCYCGGTLSYLLDGVSAVVYTVKNSYEGRDFELQEKVNRQMIHYSDGVMIQGRLYPQNCDYGCNDQYKVWRDIEEATIAEAIGAPNLWKYKKTSNMGRYVTSEGVHYRDYECYDTCGTCRISVDNGIYRGDEEDPNGSYGIMTIGHTGMDIYYPGSSIRSANTLTSKGRPGEDYVYCRDCDSHIPREEAYEYGGDYYCSDCVCYCEYFDEYRPRMHFDFVYVNGFGDVCDEALEILMKEGKVKCDKDTNDYYYIKRFLGGYDENNNWHSISTLERYYVIPEGCDKYVRKSNAINFEGKWYRADDCVTCPKCGQIIPKELADENGICPECTNAYAKTA